MHPESLDRDKSINMPLYFFVIGAVAEFFLESQYFYKKLTCCLEVFVV